jgi:hypothetical protein
VPLELFWDGEPSSVFCSAAMSSSRSALYSGEGVASSGSGEAMISPRRRAALGLARMLRWWAAAGTGDARLVCVQPSVFALGMGPAQRRSQCVSCARLLAFQRRVLECDHACAGYSNGCCRGTLTAPMTETTGGPVGDWRSIRRAGMGQYCCGTGPGSGQSRGPSRSTQNHG